MREVLRGPVPASLKDNAKTWTQDLLDAIAEFKKDKNKKVPKSVTNRYNQDDVRAALNEIYGGCCCYCDAKVGVVAHEHIEHLKPKSKYPDLAFEWENLHLACPKCNMQKGDQYDEDTPILDAAADHPVAQHLSYEEPENGDDGMYCKAMTHRGATTITLTGLNRDKLRRARLDVYLKALKVTNKINRNRDNPNVPFVKEQLVQKAARQFGSVIAFVMEVTGVRA